VKQGPFAPGRLCCPAHRHYYDPLRLPFGCLPFPGISGYRKACCSGRRPEAEEGLSSSEDNLLAIPRPLRREVLRHPLQDPRCLPWPSPFRNGLGSPLFHPLGQTGTTTLVGLHLRYGLVSCHRLAAVSSLRFDAGISPDVRSQLPGTLASPRTELAPAGCPQLVTRLRHDDLLVVMASRAAGRTPESAGSRSHWPGGHPPEITPGPSHQGGLVVGRPDPGLDQARRPPAIPDGSTGCPVSTYLGISICGRCGSVSEDRRFIAWEEHSVLDEDL